jgi:hypothetical protein
MKHLIVGLALAALMMMPASAGERSGDVFGDRPGIGEPIRFRDANGGAFRPSDLVIINTAGAVLAMMPRTSSNVRSEDRVDLSETPLIGAIFQETLSTGDAREGQLIGPVLRSGDRLVVDARSSGFEVIDLPVVLATNLQRFGAVSYRIGVLRYTPSTIVPGGERIGAAYLVDGRLVLASTGGEPAWPSLQAMFDDIF